MSFDAYRNRKWSFGMLVQNGCPHVAWETTYDGAFSPCSEEESRALAPYSSTGDTAFERRSGCRTCKSCGESVSFSEVQPVRAKL